MIWVIWTSSYHSMLRYYLHSWTVVLGAMHIQLVCMHVVRKLLQREVYFHNERNSRMGKFKEINMKHYRAKASVHWTINCLSTLELACRMIACSHEIRICMNTGVTTRMCIVPCMPYRICHLAGQLDKPRAYMPHADVMINESAKSCQA